ncbi:hypothetical protein QUF80_14515 [Desulfococcaceae bacterium HSG8]|nr:hypothetical protein [Desulfococcaceae bacterium HSG8]
MNKPHGVIWETKNPYIVWPALFIMVGIFIYNVPYSKYKLKKDARAFLEASLSEWKTSGKAEDCLLNNAIKEKMNRNDLFRLESYHVDDISIRGHMRDAPPQWPHILFAPVILHFETDHGVETVNLEYIVSYSKYRTESRKWKIRKKRYLFNGILDLPTK